MDPCEAILDAERQLTAPGAPFELEHTQVHGVPARLFKNRPPSLIALLDASAAHGDKEYLVFSDGERERRMSFAEHQAVVAAAAHVLHHDYGVSKGDRVAILAANRAEWIVGFWAAVRLGAIAVGLNGWWTRDEIEYALDHCKPAVLIADAKRLARLDGEAPVPVWRMGDEFWSKLDERAGEEPPAAEVAEDDPAIMLYTSGTTGRPKGVVHTHRNVTTLVGVSFFHGARMMMSQPTGDDAPPPLPPCVLVTSPLFHVSGLHCAAITCLASGTKSVWVEGRFDAEVALGLIQNERVTGWGYTATILHRLLNHPRVTEFDLSSLRVVGGGGSVIPASLQDRARELIPSIRPTLSVGYGLTEGCAFTTLNPGPELARYPHSVGRPVPVVDIEIRDPDGNALPHGEEGEIFMRGPLVMLEYWNDEAATRASIHPGRWLQTGDVGSFDGTRLVLASRKRDLIIRGGENVYPAEIEQRLALHPDVSEVAIVGVDHAELGQEVKAVVVPVAGANLDTDALAAWVSETLAYYKVPTHWQTRREPLPRNATGKVLKHELETASTSRFIEE